VSDYLKNPLRLIGNLRRFYRAVLKIADQAPDAERQLMLLGSMLAAQVRAKPRIDSLSDVEFSVFSQFGDDGIIQWLAGHIEFAHKTFIEFGVENYRESTTRFLLMHDNWTGFVMDGSAKHVSTIGKSKFYWRYELFARAAFIDRENINRLLSEAPLGRDIGILHIDLDGNDYWIWEQISAVSPAVVILEYNSVLGIDRAITVPYDPKFDRTRAHSSKLYWGASLPALHRLSEKKGYAFIGCNSAGNNAYFVRRDTLNDAVREVPLERGYVRSKFRESQNPAGEPTFAAGDDRLALICGLPVFNTESGQIEPL
jgi:hypothetical protein